jgi:basic amino acid/polyamine antiporter, APA family
MRENVYKTELKRDLTLLGAAAIVIGTTIGSGIFLVPSTMVQAVGSPQMVLVVWVAGGILSMFGALTYAELSSALPQAGGEYIFLREAYGPFWGFLYGWAQMWVGKSASIATLATAFFMYMANFRPELERVIYSNSIPIGPQGGPFEIRAGQLLSISVILLLAGLNYFGVKLGGRVQIAITALKIALILGIIVIGFGSGQGTVANYRTSVAATGGITGFFAALVAALWAYDGWNNVSMVSSEIRDPQRSLPRALILGTLIVAGIYIATNLAYFYVLPANGVAGSNRVAADMMRRILGSPGAAAVSIAAMISIFAALNGSILAGSRVPFAMARDGLFFRSFARVNPAYHTPAVSILGLSSWAAVLVLSGRYKELYTLVIFANWILYGMTTASVFVLRRKRPDLYRPYRTAGYPVVPVLFVFAAMCLIVSTLIDSPRESLMGIVLISAGVPFYFRWKRRKL